MAPQVKAGDGTVFTSSSQETFSFREMPRDHPDLQPQVCFFNAATECFCSGETIYLRKLPMSSSFLITAVLHQLNFPFSFYILTLQTRGLETCLLWLILLHSTYKNLGLVQPLSGLSVDFYSDKPSSNTVFKTVNMDPVLEKAVCLHCWERKRTMN